MTLSFPSLDPGPITRVVYISLAPPEVAFPSLLPWSFIFWAFPEMLIPTGPGISSSWKSENLVLPHATKACLLLGATTGSYNCHHKFPWFLFPPQLVQWLSFWVILPDNQVCCANSTPLLLSFIIQMMRVNNPESSHLWKCCTNEGRWCIALPTESTSSAGSHCYSKDF